MRRDILVLGIFLLFLGLILISSSHEVVKPEPIESWVVVREVMVDQPSLNLFVEGTLIRGDRFRAYFEPTPPSSPISTGDETVALNLTDSNGNTKSYSILMERADSSFLPEEPFPEDVANNTGTYQVSAEALYGAYLDYLSLQKIEIEETASYDVYSILLPIGFAILLLGVGISALSTRLSRHKKTRYKRPSHRTKG